MTHKPVMETEVAVILGGGFTKKGTVGQSTLLRAEAGIALARARTHLTLILSGGRCPQDIARKGISEAEAIAQVFERENFNRERLLLEEDSCETLGNAVLVAAKYLHDIKPRRLYVVTSPFHVERALLFFRSVLGPKWDIVPVVSLVADDDEARGATEAGGIAWAKKFFAEIKPGDIRTMVRRTLDEKPAYRELDWLKPENFPPAG